MKSAGDPEGARNSGMPRDRVQPGLFVEVVILTGIEHVKTADPEGYSRGKQKHTEIVGATDRDPGGGGSDTEGESEEEMRPAREAFGVGVEQDHGERHWRQPEGEAVEPGGGEDKNSARDQNEHSHETGSQRTGGQGAGLRARVGR